MTRDTRRRGAEHATDPQRALDPQRTVEIDAERLFHAARELPEAERGAYVTRLCAGRDELRREVESLLAAAGAASVLDGAPLGFTRSAAASTSELLLGTRIGPYQLESLVAEGGMGVIFRARQDEPQRLVALKLLRSALATPQALRRFQHEVELLARLQHPGIAQVYQAGLHAVGALQLPWFALELVDGARTLIEYATVARLSETQRLELFLQVVDAVQHAHQRGVIHRDLKPSNLLVDAHGRAKVIDFGVARAAAEPGAPTAFTTEAGRLVGTLQYMSPEQCSGDPGAIDVRSDVYALGLVLYELLCERVPYRVPDSSMAAAALVIQATAPQRPRNVIPGLDADLETILDKALAKEREQRYDSALALARDVRHFLAREPIEARPASVWYVLRKRAARNPLATGLGVALAAALPLFVVLLGILYARAERERALAEVEARDARVHSELLQDVVLGFRAPVPWEREAAVDPGADALALFEQRIDTAVRPERRPVLWHALAQAYTGRGEQRRALEVWQRVEQQLGPGPFDGAAAAVHLAVLRGQANAWRELGDWERAGGYAEAYVAQGASGVERCEAYALLGQCRRRRLDFDGADAAYGEALAAARAVADYPRRSYISLLKEHADLLKLAGEYARARAAYLDVLGAIDVHPAMLRGVRNALAGVYYRGGEYELAHALYTQLSASAASDSRGGLETPLHMLNNQALCLGLLGRVDDALASFETVLAGKRAAYGAEHVQVGHSLHDRALVLLRAQRIDDAGRDALAALALLERADPDVRDEYLGAVHGLLGEIELARGGCTEARREFESARAARSRWLPSTHHGVVELDVLLAACALRCGDRQRGRADGAAGLARLAAVSGLDPRVGERLRAALAAAERPPK
jgi:tetratricopeptide (TPR) repeat protein